MYPSSLCRHCSAVMEMRESLFSIVASGIQTDVVVRQTPNRVQRPGRVSVQGHTNGGEEVYLIIQHLRSLIEFRLALQLWATSIMERMC